MSHSKPFQIRFNIRIHTSLNTRPIFGLRLFTLLASFTFFTAAANSPTEIDKLTQQWLDIANQERSLITDWREQKPSLEQRITLLKAEKEQLTKSLEASRNSRNDVDDRRRVLLLEQQQLEQEQQLLDRQLARLAQFVQSMEPVLPPPLKSTWEAEQAALTDESNSTQVLQVALAKLSKQHAFNTRITTNEVTIQTPDNKQVLVTQLFLGSAFAWFTNSDGRYSGWGAPSDNQWQWHFENNSNNAQAILRALAVYQKRQPAQMIQLPVNASAFSFATLNVDSKPAPQANRSEASE